MDTSIICACLPIIPGLFRKNNTKKQPNGKQTVGQYRSSLLQSPRKDKSKGYSELEWDNTIDVRTTVEVLHGSDTDTNTIPFEQVEIGQKKTASMIL
jgi:hypothetical protein